MLGMPLVPGGFPQQPIEVLVVELNLSSGVDDGIVGKGGVHPKVLLMVQKSGKKNSWGW